MSLSNKAKAGFLALGSGLQAASSLGVAIILTRLLSQEDYATFRQTLLTYQFARPLLGLGLPVAILYFVPRAPERARIVVAEILAGLAVMGLLFASFMLLGGADMVARRFSNPDLSVTLRWFAFYPLLILPVGLVAPVLVAHEKAQKVAKFSMWTSAMRIAGAALPVVLIAREPLYAVQGLVAGALATVVPALVLIARTVPAASTSVPTISGFLSTLNYSFPLSLSRIVGTMNRNIDKLLVSAFSSPKSFAVFVNGAMEIPFFGAITGSVASVIMPQVAKSYQDGDTRQAVELFNRAMQKCAALLIGASGLLWGLAPWLMGVMYGPEYVASADYFRIYLLMIPARAVAWGVMFQASGNTPLVLVRALIRTVLNLVISYFLLLKMGPIGAAIGSFAVLYGFSIPYNLYTIGKIFKRPCVSLATVGRLVGLIVVVALGALAFQFVLNVLGRATSPDWLANAGGSAAYLVVMIAGFLVIGVSPRDLIPSKR